MVHQEATRQEGNKRTCWSRLVLYVCHLPHQDPWLIAKHCPLPFPQALLTQHTVKGENEESGPHSHSKPPQFISLLLQDPKPHQTAQCPSHQGRTLAGGGGRNSSPREAETTGQEGTERSEDTSVSIRTGEKTSKHRRKGCQEKMG